MSSDTNIQQCPVMLLRNDSHQTLLNVLGLVAIFLQGGGGRELLALHICILTKVKHSGKLSYSTVAVVVKDVIITLAPL